jgi:hypothetical protein
VASITDLKAVLRPAQRPNAQQVSTGFISKLGQWLDESYGALQKERAPGLHASSLWKTCARRVVLEAALKPTPELTRAGNFLTYDVGHALHHWWQNNYLGPMGVLIGNWRCLACNDIVVRDAFQPQACPKCSRPRSDVILYEEYRVHDPVINYVGHSDGIIELDTLRHVFEFKTASPSDFEGLDKPKLEHVVQAHAYMHALKLKSTLIVYQNKGQQCSWSKKGNRWSAGRLNIRAFVIEFDQALWQRYTKRCADHHQADALVRRLPVVAAPEARQFERLCTTPTCLLAESCPVVEACFGL